MGCAHSQNNYFKRTNNSNTLTLLRRFNVINVDGKGNEKNACELMITKTDIVVLYKNGEKNNEWPLRAIRRYGHDKNLFSFESGRKCRTGEGIFAFKCEEAEEIFVAVKSAIDNCTKFSGNAYTIDQMNSDLKDTKISERFRTKKNDSNQSQTIITNNIENQPIPHQVNYINVPANYPIDTHDYINTSAIQQNVVQNGFMKPDNSALISNESNEFNKTNLNYVQLDNLDIKTDNLLIDTKIDQCDGGVILPTIDEIDENNYTIYEPANNFHKDTNGSESCIVLIAPPTPLHKSTEQFNDFKSTNSVPTSPTNKSSSQQYSMIDFDKTKALTGIRLIP